MGKRGPKKGAIYKPTLDKIQAREFLRQEVIKGLGPMLNAQMAHARGIGHLYTRDKNGKFTKIENEAHAHKLLTEGTEEEDYWIFMKDPSVPAFTDLLNRALDRPTESIDMHVSGDADVIAKLQAARKRVGK